MLTVASALCGLFSFAQVPVPEDFPPTDYPQNYFRNPLAIPMSLAANFGELRPNHYHMGLDIRTQKKENLPVYAAADGYIAKVKIEPFGFGQAVYINHPNGYTTLYAHLNQFFPALATYVEQQQYKAESWEIFIDIPPGLFPVKKGELVAYSGNRGGSQGPHLHFEIRKTAGDINLNPLLFGLPVPDHTAPTILELAYYDRGKSLYEQTPHLLPVRRAGRAALKTPSLADSLATGSAMPVLYSVTPGLVTVSFCRISFAIASFDTQSGSANPNGIYQAVLFDNGREILGFQMNHIGYNDTRNVNAHIDYKTRETGGPFLQHLSILPGYSAPSIYRSFSPPAGGDTGRPPADGVLDLSDGATHAIRIEVKDACGNASNLEYQVRYHPPSVAVKGAIRGDSGDPSGVKRFYPGMIDGSETDDCAFYIGEKSLYDSVRINQYVSGYPASSSESLRRQQGSGTSFPDAVSSVHTIGAPFIPLQEPVLVRIRPDVDGTAKDKIVMVCSAGTSKDVQKPAWQGGWASAYFHEFGNFQLVEDRDPPVITPIGIRDGAVLTVASRFAFSIKDNLGEVKHFRAELDGKWLCFTNDKGLDFIYRFDNHCPPGEHLLKITVEDVAGNRAKKEYHFIR
jgi:Peptidase family M23